MNFRQAAGLAIVCVPALLVLLANVAAARPAVTEDAFITLRFARNLATGHGLSYSAGEPPVEGFSNMLWTVWLALLNRLGFDLVASAYWCGLTAATATLAVVTRTSLRLLPPALAWLPAIVLASTPGFHVFACSGLESGVAALAVAVGLDAVIGQRRWGQAFAASAALALARPEGPLLFVSLTAWRFLSEGPRNHRVVLRGWVLPFLAFYGVYVAAKWAYFGYPLPNTFYFKVANLYRAEPGLPPLRGLQYIAGFLTRTPIYLLLLPLSKAALGLEGLAAPVTLLAAWAGFLILVGGDWYWLWRFMVPVLPAFGLLAAAALATLRERGRLPAAALALLLLSVSQVTLGKTPSEPISPTLAPALVAVLGGGSFEWPRRELYDPPHMEREIPRTLQRLYPAHLTLASHQAGRIAYFWPGPFLDLFGLANTPLSHLHDRAEREAWLGRRAPELVLFFDDLDLHHLDWMRGTGYRLDRALVCHDPPAPLHTLLVFRLAASLEELPAEPDARRMLKGDLSAFPPSAVTTFSPR